MTMYAIYNRIDAASNKRLSWIVAAPEQARNKIDAALE